MEMVMRGVKGKWAREQRLFTFVSSPSSSWASRVALVVKSLPADAGDARNLGSIPGLGRSPGEGTGNPFQYSCLENPHGQRSLAGYSPWVRKESETAERFSTCAHPALLNTPLDCFIGTSNQTHLTPSSPLPTTPPPSRHIHTHTHRPKKQSLHLSSLSPPRSIYSPTDLGQVLWRHP